MSGALVKIAETTVSSATASVTLTGIDSTFDVYKVVLSDVQGDTDIQSLKVRVTASGTAQDSANYDYAKKTLRANTSFSNSNATNQTEVFVNTQLAMGTGTEETLQGVQYLFNFNDSDDYSFATDELVFRSYDSGSLMGGQGSWLYTVAEVHDGVNYFMSSGNIASGTFTLYGLKK
jgi:hypothetical protein